MVLRKPLDYETLSNFTVAIRAQVHNLDYYKFQHRIIHRIHQLRTFQDQGNPPQYSEALVYVNVIDADDQNPKFFDDRYYATLPDHATQVVHTLSDYNYWVLKTITTNNIFVFINREPD